MEELDPDIFYYFLCPAGDKYYNLFIGWLMPDLIEAFKHMEEEGSPRAHIKLTVGSNTFISMVDKPLYLVDYQKDEIFDFAGDDNDLEIFAGIEDPPELDVPPIIEFPSYFEKGIEPHLDYRLGKEFCKNENGVWIPI